MLSAPERTAEKLYLSSKESSNKEFHKTMRSFNKILIKAYIAGQCNK